MARRHDPVPDGKTGPWGRKPHLKDAKGRLTPDARCGRCYDLLNQRPADDPTLLDLVRRGA